MSLVFVENEKKTEFNSNFYVTKTKQHAIPSIQFFEIHRAQKGQVAKTHQCKKRTNKKCTFKKTDLKN